MSNPFEGEDLESHVVAPTRKSIFRNTRLNTSASGGSREESHVNEKLLEGVRLKFITKDILVDVLQGSESNFGSVSIDRIYESLKSHYAEENIQFLMALKALKRRDVLEQRDLKRLLKTYISESGERQINIPDKVRRTTQSELEGICSDGCKGSVDKEKVAEVLGAAEDAVVDLIAKQDYIQTYVQQNMYNASAESIKGYRRYLVYYAVFTSALTVALLLTSISRYFRLFVFPFLYLTVLYYNSLTCKL